MSANTARGVHSWEATWWPALGQPRSLGHEGAPAKRKTINQVALGEARSPHKNGGKNPLS